MPSRKKRYRDSSAIPSDCATHRLHTPHELADLRLFERALTEFNTGRFADAKKLFERLRATLPALPATGPQASSKFRMTSPRCLACIRNSSTRPARTTASRCTTTRVQILTAEASRVPGSIGRLEFGQGLDIPVFVRGGPGGSRAPAAIVARVLFYRTRHWGESELPTSRTETDLASRRVAGCERTLRPESGVRESSRIAGTRLVTPATRASCEELLVADRREGKQIPGT